MNVPQKLAPESTSQDKAVQGRKLNETCTMQVRRSERVFMCLREEVFDVGHYSFCALGAE